jgi:homoserine kinase
VVIWSEHPARVRVPATSANLGPGFDTLGLALALHDEVEARVTLGGLDICVDGAGEDTAGAGERHLVVTAMRAAFDAMGGQPPGLALRCANAIPHGRGLGSSAAAVVAGVLAARELVKGGVDLLPDTGVLELAVDLEGHPDNVAACLAGGLTIAWRRGEAGDGGVGVLRLAVLDGLSAVACVPPTALATHEARRVLPGQVPHADASANAARCALLIAGLTTDPAVLFDATEDFLHQRYRAPVMPETADLLGRLRRAGAAAVISGAGPSILVLTMAGQLLGLEVVDSIARETGIPWHVIPLDVDRQGAATQPGPDAHLPDTRQGRSFYQAPGPGVPAGAFPQDRVARPATHGPLSRECRGLLWC